MEAGVLDPAPIWTNAETFDASPFYGRVHGFIGGYPCPGESLAGLRQKHLYKGFIWPSIRRAIDAARPLWCFFENVDDHLTGTFPIVHRSLRNMGYRVEAGIFTAEEVGAPHERQRLFILAVSGSIYRDLSKITWQDNSDATGCSKEMANHYSSRCKQPGGQKSKNKEVFEAIKCISPDKWPLGQGSEQYEFEQPRIVKPGVGCTIDGYNFREDLLRALGNSVVEQTAALAFKTLLQKHLK
jgi:DNA (cytosine-5)-methyltransferase 1